jgi:hypothetical protein
MIKKIVFRSFAFYGLILLNSLSSIKVVADTDPTAD